MNPSEVILRKNLVASGLSSAEWASVSAALRDRAFFSSRVESVRFLETCRTRIAKLLANAQNADGATTSRGQVVSDIMRAARDAGISRGTASVTDPGSAARANVIIDTNAAMAAGYVRAEQSNSYGARLAFPAQELVRIEQRDQPRDWHGRWRAAGGKLYGGRMIALKEDPIWTSISRFGNPYPPFDFNSGMGVEDVSFEDAVSLGVIKEEYQPPEKSPLKAFNEGLEADLKFNNDGEWQRLSRIFGDQIRHQDGQVSWRHDLISKAFDAEKPFAIRLGEATPDLLSKLPSSVSPETFQSKPLTVDQTWLDRKRADGTDHRSHFFPHETNPNNIPLTVSDLELIPSIWREPDSVQAGSTKRKRIVLERSSLDGGRYRMVVDVEKNPYLVTFYKKKSAE